MGPEVLRPQDKTDNFSAMRGVQRVNILVIRFRAWSDNLPHRLSRWV